MYRIIDTRQGYEVVEEGNFDSLRDALHIRFEDREYAEAVCRKMNFESGPVDDYTRGIAQGIEIMNREDTEFSPHYS